MFSSLRLPALAPRHHAAAACLPAQASPGGRGTWDCFAELWLQERPARLQPRAPVAPVPAASRRPVG